MFRLLFYTLFIYNCSLKGEGTQNEGLIEIIYILFTNLSF